MFGTAVRFQHSHFAVLKVKDSNDQTDDDKGTKDDPLAPWDKLYERYRKRVVEEDGVINHRMMWGTLAQTALFAGFGLASARELTASVP